MEMTDEEYEVWKRNWEELAEKEFEKYYISTVDNHLFLQIRDAFKDKKKQLRKVYLRRPATTEDIHKTDWSMWLIGSGKEHWIGQAKYDGDGKKWMYRITDEPYQVKQNVWKQFVDE